MEEKQALLYKAAKTLFTKNGFKSTSVAQIAKEAGLAVGTFYLYYPSKEKLFLDIFLAENTALKQRCQAQLDVTLEPKQMIAHMLACNSEGMRNNPILREWYNRKVFAKLEQVYRLEHGGEAVHFLYDTFVQLVETWQAEGKIRSGIDAKTIILVFTAIVNIDVHKEEIGVEHFPRLLDVLASLVMDGLMQGGQDAQS
ncbi:MAG: TetR/AcrR family transcriptional regulator [Spirochaetales bacterium]|nr:TetR/AcrR family transcriptional regulator [Spirochaetales bacterium]